MSKKVINNSFSKTDFGLEEDFINNIISSAFNRDRYLELLSQLKVAIWKYAADNNIDMNDEDALIEYCSSMRKISLGSDFTKYLLEGILNDRFGDQRILKFLDLSDVDFAGQDVSGVDFRGTNANINPQTVKYKSLSNTNLAGIDMSNKCFDGCSVDGANLSYTGARINPRTLNHMSLYHTNCSGLDFSGADFTDVNVKGTNFTDAKNLDLNPQKVSDRDLSETILKNVDLSNCSFAGCHISNSDLSNTGATIIYSKNGFNSLLGANLTGTTLVVDDRKILPILRASGVTIGKSKISDFPTLKRYIISKFHTSPNKSVDINNIKLDFTEEQYKELILCLKVAIWEYAKKHKLDMSNPDTLVSYCKRMPKINLGPALTTYLLKGIMNYKEGDKRMLNFLDLDGVDFAGIDIRNTDFRGTNASVDPQNVLYKMLSYTNFSGLDMSDKCFDGCHVDNANLSYTGANIKPYTVFGNSLYNTDCSGLDFSGKYFDNVNVVGANFTDAKNLDLDPKHVKDRNLANVNLTNVDMHNKCFDECNISGAKLCYTGAVLNYQYLSPERMKNANLNGTTLFVDKDDDVDILLANGVILGDVRLTTFPSAKQYIKLAFALHSNSNV